MKMNPDELEKRLKGTGKHDFKDLEEKIKAAKKEKTCMSRAALQGMIGAVAFTIPTVLFFDATYADFVNQHYNHARNSAIWGSAAAFGTIHFIKRVYNAIKQKEDIVYTDRVIAGQHDD